MNIPGADKLVECWARWRVRQRGVPLLSTWQPTQTRRILLVLTTGLGDAVFSSAVIDPLRQLFPQAEFGLFLRQTWLPLFARDNRLARLIPYAGKYRRYWATYTALRAFAPDLTLVLHANDPDILPLLYLAGCEYLVRIPIQGTRYPWLLANRQRLQDQQTLPQRHYVENRLRILETLCAVGGLAYPSAHPAHPPDWSPRLLLGNSSAQIGALPIALRNLQQPYIVLHPHAADAYKSWPRANLQRCIELLLARGYAVVLTGTRADAASLATLASDLATPALAARLLNLLGQLDLTQMLQVLQGAQAVIAPDTGILHVAAALGRPVLGLYAATDARWVGPRAPAQQIRVVQKPQTCVPCTEKRCPYVEPICMAQVDAETVCQQLDGLLENTSNENDRPSSA